MDKKRINEIFKNKSIEEIYYNEQPVWVQEVSGDIARVGFLNSNETKDLHINDLYEKNLYN